MSVLSAERLYTEILKPFSATFKARFCEEKVERRQDEARVSARRVRRKKKLLFARTTLEDRAPYADENARDTVR